MIRNPFPRIDHVGGRLLLAPIIEGRRTPFAKRATSHTNLLSQLQLVQHDRTFHFISRTTHKIIFSTQATTLDDARQKFQASGHNSSDALFIIKTETEIYLLNA